MRSYEDADNFPCPYCGIAANPGGLTCDTCPRCGGEGCNDCILAGYCCNHAGGAYEEEEGDE